MTLKEIVYRKIAEATTHPGYIVNNKIWYVIPWMKGTWIHYTIKNTEQAEIILWYLAGTIEPPPFNAQTKYFEMKDMRK